MLCWVETLGLLEVVMVLTDCLVLVRVLVWIRSGSGAESGVRLRSAASRKPPSSSSSSAASSQDHAVFFQNISTISGFKPNWSDRDTDRSKQNLIRTCGKEPTVENETFNVHTVSVEHFRAQGAKKLQRSAEDPHEVGSDSETKTTMDSQQTSCPNVN
ncbi:hypothetical protein XENOCAPTIV_022505 [Xenoophorus captivus]|uniref:Uncharacterized protein n=1 Tax=Xenoophorus captivus TaxID=1517983 RepID=A0ABV0RIX2_9TELE